MYYTLCIHWIGCVCNGVLCTALCDPIWILGGWIPSRKLHLGVRNPPYQTRHRADHRLVWFPRDVSHVELSHMLRLLSPPITTYMCNWLLWMMLCLVVLFFCVFCCFVFFVFCGCGMLELWRCEGVKACVVSSDASLWIVFRTCSVFLSGSQYDWPTKFQPGPTDTYGRFPTLTRTIQTASTVCSARSHCKVSTSLQCTT